MRKMFYSGTVMMLSLASVGCGHRHALQAAQASMPSPPPLMTRQILNAVDAGDGDIVVRDLRRRILEQPDRLDLRLELVSHLEKRGESELVLEHLRLLAERYPANEDLHLRLARSLRAAGARDEALRILRNLTARQSVTTPAAFSLTGILLDELERPMEGEAEHRRALELARGDVDVYESNLGYNLLAQGRDQEAVALFESALRRRPRSEVARNNLGVALGARRDGEIDKAAILTHWKSVTDPASAHNNLAALLMERERYAEARLELEESLKLQPDLPEAWRNLQLLSELDGKPITLTPNKLANKTRNAEAAKNSGWHKVLRGVRNTFVADEDPVLKPKGSTRRASR
ncbi:MAG: tetratricopeptide repeat protein [Bryobacteraceae bacterium]|nr:tetratricopeptide repeat protein [Bryobacteraceae bacterium]